MSKVSKKVANWLYTVLQPQYLHTEIAYRDIYRFLAVYMGQGFKVRTAVYTSPSGRSELLVNLHGSFPAERVSIPLSIWIPVNYPYADANVAAQAPNGVPIVYVIPPEGHVIKTGNYFDSQGCFYHPFLQQWYNTNGPQAQPGTFDLIALMNCLASVFEGSSPIAPIPPVTGPALPPKPSRDVISPQSTGAYQRAPLSGPPLPQKPFSGSQSPEQIPLKYQAPLPLPQQSTGSPAPPIVPHAVYPNPASPRSPRASLNQSFVSPAQSPQFPKASLHESPIRQSPDRRYDAASEHQQRSPPHRGHASPKNGQRQSHPEQTTSIEDLMDKVTLESEKTDVDKELLERLAHQINEIIAPQKEGSINSIVQKINESVQRTTALHSQLSHFNSQATTNVENLDKHISYLKEQVSAVENLNNSLVELERENAKNDQELYIDLARNSKIKLEELVIADSALVNQLYDTTADIKAHKDAIKLVSGNYGAEPELVDGSNLEACMAVRSLSRDLFWLEIIRAEIANKMGLHV